jgi:uncharacterized protein (DUF433 family)
MIEPRLNSRIAISRDICHGQPRIAGTRIMIHQILDLLAGGRTINEILSEDYFPDLTIEDVRASLNYASQVIQSDAVIPVP